MRKKYLDLMYIMLHDFIRILSNKKLLSIEISILSFVSATKRNQWKNIYKKNVKWTASIYESHSMIKLRSIWLNRRWNWLIMNKNMAISLWMNEWKNFLTFFRMSCFRAHFYSFQFAKSSFARRKSVKLGYKYTYTYLCK